MAEVGAILAYNAARAAGNYGLKRYRQYRASARPSSRTLARSGFRRGRSYRGVSKNFMKNYLKITESKFIDLNVNAMPVQATSSVIPINVIGVGDIDILRDGENTLVTSVQFNIRITSDQDQIVDQVTRLLLVLKKDVRGATITMTNLFVADSVFQMRTVQNSKNFKILKAFNWVQPAPEIQTQRRVKMIRYYHKFKKPIRIKYLSTDNTIAGMDRNALFLIFMTDAGATLLPTFFGEVRVTFKDV